MSSEQETKKLLGFRESMEQRILELEQEIQNLQKAIEEIDKLIVNTGFKTFTTADALLPSKTITPPTETIPQSVSEENLEELMNITSKDGTILGSVQVEGHSILFTPEPSFEFHLDIPPFQSFLIERVLENMQKNDQERATNGEIDPSEILEYAIKEEDGKIIQLTIENFGGERRLREINSSLRWTLDKMYDKITQG
jgi:ribosomal protein L11